MELELNPRARKTLRKLKQDDQSLFKRANVVLDRMREDPWHPQLTTHKYACAKDFPHARQGDRLWDTPIGVGTKAWRIYWRELRSDAGLKVDVLYLGPHIKGA